MVAFGETLQANVHPGWREKYVGPSVEIKLRTMDWRLNGLGSVRGFEGGHRKDRRAGLRR